VTPTECNTINYNCTEGQDGGLRLNNQPITAPEARQLWDTVSKALNQDEDNERLKCSVEAF
jgi:hypothetical protein